MQIILDISANTHKNNEAYYRRMIESIYAVDIPVIMKEDEQGIQGAKHRIIIKGQLFRKAGNNIPQDFAMFERMANWTYETYGFETTASVFDKVSLALLLLMDIPYGLPFIKIANNRDLDWLIGEIPRKIPVYKSVSPEEYWRGNHYQAGNLKEQKITPLCCVSKYPAEEVDYLQGAWWHWQNPLEHPNPWDSLCSGLGQRWFSDHTVGLDFFMRARPTIWEKHFKLEDSTGLDAGDWAITPEELGCILADLALR